MADELRVRAFLVGEYAFIDMWGRPGVIGVLAVWPLSEFPTTGRLALFIEVEPRVQTETTLHIRFAGDCLKEPPETDVVLYPVPLDLATGDELRVSGVVAWSPLLEIEKPGDLSITLTSPDETLGLFYRRVLPVVHVAASPEVVPS